MQHSGTSVIDRYIEYISAVRRYSPRTRDIYSDVLEGFVRFSFPEKENGMPEDREIIGAMTEYMIRGYEMHLLEDRKLVPKTVNLHISALSGFCRFLMANGLMEYNPAGMVRRPKVEKRLPEFYRHDDIASYFRQSDIFAGEPVCPGYEKFIEGYIKARQRHGYRPENDPTLTFMYRLGPGERFDRWLYGKRLKRALIATLYSTGMRRAELVSLKRDSIDFFRKIIKIKGKGDKERQIPLIPSLSKEISLYLQSVETMECSAKASGSPLFVTPTGRPVYPGYVDRAVKSELGESGDITIRKSPHVFRHTLATELLNDGAGLNPIKELLGHSSLATTQVYTHNSIEKLKKVYETAHPRAKNGGKHGD